MSASLVLWLSCGPAPRIQRAAVIGSYVFETNSLDSHHGNETLTLRDDGTFVQRYLAPGAAKEVVSEGTWGFVASKRPPMILLDGYRPFGENGWESRPRESEVMNGIGFEIYPSNGRMHIEVDYDLGQEYVQDEARNDRSHR